MSVTHSPTTFAFGGNEVDGCQCPALAAGMDPIGIGDDHIPGMLEVAEKYDNLVQDEERNYEGTVSEKVAKDAWTTLIEEKLEPNTCKMTVAKDVAAYHDWI